MFRGVLRPTGWAVFRFDSFFLAVHREFFLYGIAITMVHGLIWPKRHEAVLRVQTGRLLALQEIPSASYILATHLFSGLMLDCKPRLFWDEID